MNRWTQQYWAQRALFLVEMHKRARSEKQDPKVVRAIEELAAGVARVGNLLRNGPTPPTPCGDDEGCGGCGVLFQPELVPEGAQAQFSRPPTVERCDRCKQYLDDSDAINEAAFVFSGRGV